MDGDYIIIPMQKQPIAPEGPSFLQKFEGRNHKISRDGLLKLLNAKRHSPSHLHQVPSLPHKIQKQSNPTTPPQHHQPNIQSKQLSPQKHQKSTPKRIFLSQELKASKGVRSERMLLQQESEERTKNQFKLPIIPRSRSQSSNIIAQHVFTPPMQMIESDRPHRTDKRPSFPSKRNDRASKQMELDQYVLRHLQFLDKFEQQFLTNRPNPNPNPKKQ